MFWTKNSDPATLAVGDETVKLVRSPRSRRMRLTFDPAAGRAELRLPPRTSLASARRFIAEQLDWIARQRRAIGAPPRAQPGGALLLDGIPVTIRHDPAIGRTVRLEPGALVVGGPADLLGKRLRRWLVERARADMTARVHRHALQLGRPAPPVTIRDTRSRWGSCSRTGAINLSWRLICAPEAVRDYVCAHEAAHLVHMHHGPAFWAEVDRLGVDAPGGRAWLKAHGRALLALVT